MDRSTRSRSSGWMSRWKSSNVPPKLPGARPWMPSSVGGAAHPATLEVPLPRTHPAGFQCEPQPILTPAGLAPPAHGTSSPVGDL